VGRFLLVRLCFAAVLVVASSSAALLLTRLAPADVSAQLGPQAPRAEIAATRARFDLDRSPLSQLALWLGRAARFDFGNSFLFGRPVGPLVAQAALNTAVLGIVALALATVIGLGLGILTGSRRGAVPAIVSGLSLLFVSLPPLLTSILLVFVAARTGWLPAGGMSSGDLASGGGVVGGVFGGAVSWGSWLVDLAWHLPLPALALALPMASTFERLQSQSMADAVREPFVLAAAARGVRPRDLILRHAWPVSLRPITAVYGVAIGTMLSGSFVVEYVTAWPGLGRTMFEALRARDIYLVAGCAAMGALLLGIGTLIGDLLHAFVDPRVREGESL
jgi:peptide/nickel transport system permease protein